MVTTTIRNVYLTKPWGVLELKFYDIWMILLIAREQNLKKNRGLESNLGWTQLLDQFRNGINRSWDIILFSNFNLQHFEA